MSRPQNSLCLNLVDFAMVRKGLLFDAPTPAHRLVVSNAILMVIPFKSLSKFHIQKSHLTYT